MAHNPNKVTFREVLRVRTSTYLLGGGVRFTYNKHIEVDVRLFCRSSSFVVWVNYDFFHWSRAERGQARLILLWPLVLQEAPGGQQTNWQLGYLPRLQTGWPPWVY